MVRGGRLERKGFAAFGTGLPLAGSAHAAFGRALFVLVPFVGGLCVGCGGYASNESFPNRLLQSTL